MKEETPKEIENYRCCSICGAIEVEGETILRKEDYDEDLLLRLGIHLSHGYLSDECLESHYPGEKSRDNRKSCRGRTLNEIFGQGYSRVALSGNVAFFEKDDVLYTFIKEGELYKLHLADKRERNRKEED